MGALKFITQLGLLATSIAILTNMPDYLSDFQLYLVLVPILVAIYMAVSQ